LCPELAPSAYFQACCFRESSQELVLSELSVELALLEFLPEPELLERFPELDSWELPPELLFREWRLLELESLCQELESLCQELELRFLELGSPCPVELYPELAWNPASALYQEW